MPGWRQTTIRQVYGSISFIWHCHSKSGDQVCYLQHGHDRASFTCRLHLGLYCFTHPPRTCSVTYSSLEDRTCKVSRLLDGKPGSFLKS